MPRNALASSQSNSLLNQMATPIVSATSNAYPVVGSALSGFNVVSTPADNSGRVLEYYPAGEEDSPSPDKPYLQLFGDKVRPEDVAGDVTSHFLRKTDPTVQSYYRNFENSLTPQQQSNLLEQYKWAQKNEGEKRPYGSWLETSGLPAYFRGYAFGQWDNPQRWYTPEQMKMFDEMINYLKTPKAK